MCPSLDIIINMALVFVGRRVFSSYYGHNVKFL